MTGRTTLAAVAPEGSGEAGRGQPLLLHILRLVLDSISGYSVCMKTTVDIPDGELEDAMRFTRARTKREAIVTAITEFNRRRRMAELTKRAGTCADLMTIEDLQRQRRRR